MADLMEEVYNLVDVLPERQLPVAIIAKSICDQFPEFHSGDIRRAVRMLVDAERAQLIPGNILVLN